MRTTRFITLAFLVTFLAACASSNSGSVYSRDEARKTQTVKTGVVESVRQVKLEGTKSPVGTVAQLPSLQVELTPENPIPTSSINTCG